MFKYHYHKELLIFICNIVHAIRVPILIKTQLRIQEKNILTSLFFIGTIAIDFCQNVYAVSFRQYTARLIITTEEMLTFRYVRFTFEYFCL
jgi:hypothetical protein